MQDKIYIGGLMRCCIATVKEVRLGKTDTPEENDKILCKYCKDSAVFKDGGWRWNNEGYIS